MEVNIHAFAARSRANGPGERAVVWFQGCPLRCPGCFNPHTHAEEPVQITTVERLLQRIRREAPRIEGVTVSGGEPFAQAQALLALVEGVRADTPLSILVFSGYTMKEIARRPLGEGILAALDVLVAGRYVARKHHGTALLGSANQRIHLLSDRYRLEDVTATPEAEVLIGAAGEVIVSGVAGGLSSSTLLEG